jgi:flagellar hook-basal body complex protein FliE
MDLRGIGSASYLSNLEPAGKTAETSKPQGKDGFKDALLDSIKSVEAARSEADESVARMALGKGEDIHKVMIALEKADISFQLMVQVRNKVVGAYEEIMRMGV